MLLIGMGCWFPVSITFSVDGDDWFEIFMLMASGFTSKSWLSLPSTVVMGWEWLWIFEFMAFKLRTKMLVSTFSLAILGGGENRWRNSQINWSHVRMNGLEIVYQFNAGPYKWFEIFVNICCGEISSVRMWMLRLRRKYSTSLVVGHSSIFNPENFSWHCGTRRAFELVLLCVLNCVELKYGSCSSSHHSYAIGGISRISLTFLLFWFWAWLNRFPIASAIACAISFTEKSIPKYESAGACDHSLQWHLQLESIWPRVFDFVCICREHREFTIDQHEWTQKKKW